MTDLEPVRDGLADTLTPDFIADLIRLPRKADPAGWRIDEGTAGVRLTITLVYRRKMQLFAGHFAQMPVEADA